MPLQQNPTQERSLASDFYLANTQEIFCGCFCKFLIGNLKLAKIRINFGASTKGIGSLLRL
jgi:hypothetical protein